MARKLYRWRTGTDPNYTYTWAADPPATDAVAVDVVDESLQVIKQHDLSSARYQMVPVIFDIPALSTRYHDTTVPDYTTGWDIRYAEIPANALTTGDLLVTGKGMVGKIGAIAVPASIGATQVTVVSTFGVLRQHSLGGVVDEGVFLSFGTESSTAAAINATDPSANLINPSPELPEYEVKRISAETDIGDGLGITTFTLFSALADDVAPNDDVNLVVRFIRDGIEITTGEFFTIGDEVLGSTNLPAGRIVRVGYKNTSISAARVRGRLVVLY